MPKYEVIKVETNQGSRVIKSWTKGVPFDEKAKEQVKTILHLPFIHKHIAVMPDVHGGLGSTIGSVIPTIGAIIPAAVGVDIGCGMIAARTTLRASDLPDSLKILRHAIEACVPHGRTDQGRSNDKGAWQELPVDVLTQWEHLDAGFNQIVEKNPSIKKSNNIKHLGTLGTGNHFIEICLDEAGEVWIMLHSGSRGVGNRIGSYFIEKAKKDMEKWFINLPDKNLSYFPEGTDGFKEYVEAVEWAQDYAFINRKVMLNRVIIALAQHTKTFNVDKSAINCHHNYVTRENHYGKNILVTRKGAVRARQGDLGIIPGSMGAKSFIVEGLGNPESFCSCSHGAGRVMGRKEAKRVVTLEEHVKAVKGVECRLDEDVIDETPSAYKNIDQVMEAQSDLVRIKHTLKQVLCVKG